MNEQFFTESKGATEILDLVNRLRSEFVGQHRKSLGLRVESEESARRRALAAGVRVGPSFADTMSARMARLATGPFSYTLPQ